MKPRTVFFVAILFLVAIFAALNWSTFNAPTTLSFAVGQAEAPLGVLLMAVIGVLCVIFLLMIARVETAALLESRRGLKELEKARKLADSAEESRFKELRKRLEDGLDALHEKLDALIEQGEQEELTETIRKEGDEIEERVDRAEGELKKAIKGRG